MSDEIKTVILCGGMGTRLKEETEYRPKPMVEIGGKPILWHIMKIYSHHEFNNFVLCLGYKGDFIRQFFLNYRVFNNDIIIDLQKDLTPSIIDKIIEPWTIALAETGMKTGTAGRIRKIRDLVGDTFFVTYGDGVGNVDIRTLLEFHRSHGKVATITAVHPPSRFGLLELDGTTVSSFRKKAAINEGWIDGGFFVFDKRIFDYLERVGSEEMLEGKTLETLAEEGELMAYRHDGFWKCMDTHRDMKDLENDITAGQAEWMVWEKEEHLEGTP